MASRKEVIFVILLECGFAIAGIVALYFNMTFILTKKETQGEVISIQKIKAYIDEDLPLRVLHEAIARLQNEYESGHHGLRLQEVADGYQFRTKAIYSKFVQDILDITPVTKPIYEKNAQGKYIKTDKTYTQYVADPVKLLIARSLFSSRGFTYFDRYCNCRKRSIRINVRGRTKRNPVKSQSQ